MGLKELNPSFTSVTVKFEFILLSLIVGTHLYYILLYSINKRGFFFFMFWMNIFMFWVYIIMLWMFIYMLWMNFLFCFECTMYINYIFKFWIYIIMFWMYIFMFWMYIFMFRMYIFMFRMYIFMFRMYIFMVYFWIVVFLCFVVSSIYYLYFCIVLYPVFLVLEIFYWDVPLTPHSGVSGGGETNHRQKKYLGALATPQNSFVHYMTSWMYAILRNYRIHSWINILTGKVIINWNQYKSI